MSYPNSIIVGVGFYISFNDVDVYIYGSVTTALVIGQMDKFYILNGDHRQAYRDRISSGLDVCISYFKENPAEVNHRSDKLTKTSLEA